MRKTEDEQGIKYVKKLLFIIIGAALGLVFCIIILIAFTFLVNSGVVPQDLMYKTAVFGCFIGACAGSQFTIRKNRTKALLMGVATGLFLYLFLMIIGAMLYEDFSLGNGGLGLFIAASAGGVLGGFIGSREKKRRKYLK